MNNLSRLVVDPERFLDPEREATEAVGRGAVYTRGFDGTPLRDEAAPDWPAVRAALIARHFVPYYARIEQIVADMVATYGTCTVVDVHSYPSMTQPYELAGGTLPAPRWPAVRIGTDAQHGAFCVRNPVRRIGNEADRRGSSLPRREVSVRLYRHRPCVSSSGKVRQVKKFLQVAQGGVRNLQRIDGTLPTVSLSQGAMVGLNS